MDDKFSKEKFYGRNSYGGVSDFNSGALVEKQEKEEKSYYLRTGSSGRNTKREPEGF